MLIIILWGSGTFFFNWWVNRGSDPTDYSLPVSSVHGILQARILEWTFPSPGDLPNPGIKPRSPTLQAVSLLSEPPRKPFKQRFCPSPWLENGSQNLNTHLTFEGMVLLLYLLYWILRDVETRYHQLHALKQ